MSGKCTNAAVLFSVTVMLAGIGGCKWLKGCGGGGTPGEIHTTVPAVPVRVVMTEAEAEKFLHHDFDPTVFGYDKRKALWNGKVVGLDLKAAEEETIRDLVGNYPEAASSLRADLPDLCDGALDGALEEAGVERLSLTVWGYSPESISCLKKLDVDELYLAWTEADDSVVSRLAHVDTIRELYLGGTDVTDASLEYIAQLEDLRTLDLEGTDVSDEGIGYIAGLKKLEELRRLDLGGTRITDASLSLLEALEELRDLDLFGTSVTEEGVEHLAELENLRYLNLGRAVITGDSVEALKKLTQLEKLDLSFCGLAEPELAEIEEALEGVEVVYRRSPF